MFHHLPGHRDAIIKIPGVEHAGAVCYCRDKGGRSSQSSWAVVLSG